MITSVKPCWYNSPPNVCDSRIMNTLLVFVLFGWFYTDHFSIYLDHSEGSRKSNDFIRVSAVRVKFIGKSLTSQQNILRYDDIKLVKLVLQESVCPYSMALSCRICPNVWSRLSPFRQRTWKKKIGYATHLLGKWVHYGLVCDFGNSKR